MKIAPALIAAGLLILATPAMAQDQIMTLQAQGNVMVSDGGEFATAASGTQLQAGNRLMLAEGASARVVYSNGCDMSYKKAGVYSVPLNCTPVANANTGHNLAAAGMIAGGTLIGAALLNSMDETQASPDTPVSR